MVFREAWLVYGAFKKVRYLRQINFAANIVSEAFFLKDKLKIRSADTVNAEKLHFILFLYMCLHSICIFPMSLAFESGHLKFSEKWVSILLLC